MLLLKGFAQQPPENLYVSFTERDIFLTVNMEAIFSLQVDESRI